MRQLVELAYPRLELRDVCAQPRDLLDQAVRCSGNVVHLVNARSLPNAIEICVITRFLAL